MSSPIQPQESSIEARALAEIESELWRHGDLKWMLRPHQVALYEDLERHFSASSGSPLYAMPVSRRFGKTTVLLLRALEHCLRFDNWIVRFVAPQLKDARQIASEVILPLFLPAPPGMAPVWDSLNSCYRVGKGSRIHINGANNGHEDDSRGRRADESIVDEAGFIDRLAYLVNSVLMPQLVEGDKIGAMILSSTPSESPAHPFEGYCQAGIVSGNYSRYTLDDNAYLSAEVKGKIIHEAGGRSSTAYRREYNAEFVVEETRAIVPEWASAQEVCTAEVERDDLYKFYDKYVGMDLGVVHYTVILYGYYHFKKAVVVIEREQYMKGPEVRSDRIADMIVDTEANLWGAGAGMGSLVDRQPYCRVADNNNPILLNDLNGMHQIYVRPTTKDSLAAMVNAMRLWVKTKRVIIDPSCKMLLGCLSAGIWTVKRDKWDESEAFGHYDALAALMYLLRNVDESHNPIPATLGMSPCMQWINPVEIERKGQLKAKLDKLGGG